MVIGSLLGTVALVPTRASADVTSSQTQVKQLEQRIIHDGEVLQGFVAAYNAALSQLAIATERVTAAQQRLAADQVAESRDMTELRALAIAHYVSSANEDSSLAVFSTGDITSSAAQEEYTQLANRGLHDTVDAVYADVRQTQADETTLRADQAQAQAVVVQAGAARQAAQAALAQDEALLSQAKSSLAAALAAAEAARRAAEAAAEAALAGQGPIHPVDVTISPSPGTYVNPLRGVGGLTAERIDQGVDYHGYGPIYAVGDGRVISTSNSGWPGGTFISYKLLDGPAAGLVVFAAEDIDPTVSVGQTVSAATVLGTVYEGSDGIETGWADPSGDGETMARDYGQFNGSNSTAFGANFSQMLASLGAPGGVLQNNPPTGHLPPGWPTW